MGILARRKTYDRPQIIRERVHAHRRRCYGKGFGGNSGNNRENRVSTGVLAKRAPVVQRLVFVRQAHEDTLWENGYAPIIDPGKTLVDQIMAGTEHLLADLDNTENQKKN
jgi:hypothetical protein